MLKRVQHDGCSDRVSISAHLLEQPGEVAAAARDEALDDELLDRHRPALAVDPDRILDGDLAGAGAELPVAAVGQREADALAVFRHAELDVGAEVEADGEG